MPDYSIEEAQQQAIKAGAYFAKVLKWNTRSYLATRVNGVTVVIAMDMAGEILESALTEGKLLGNDTVIHRPPEPRDEPETDPPAGKPADADSGSSDGSVLECRYHIPPSQVYPGSRGGHAGNVHLHVTEAMVLGRRKREKGECLCSKKNGNMERTPEGETKMCGECVTVAAANGLTWSL